MENRTVGDSLADATKNLEHAIDADGYHELDAHQQAYLQEALYYLEVVQNGSSQTRRSNAEATPPTESR